MGLLTMGLAVGLAGIDKMVVPLALSCVSLWSGPSFGIFTAGIFFSFTNSWVGVF